MLAILSSVLAIVLGSPQDGTLKSGITVYSPGAGNCPRTRFGRINGRVVCDERGNEIYISGLIDEPVPDAIKRTAIKIGIDKNAGMQGFDDGFTPIVVGYVQPKGEYPAGARFVRVMWGGNSNAALDIAFLGSKAVCARKMTWNTCDELPLPAAQGRAVVAERARQMFRRALSDSFSAPARERCIDGRMVSVTIGCGR